MAALFFIMAAHGNQYSLFLSHNIMLQLKKYLVIALTIIVIIGAICVWQWRNNTITPAFYYWESTYKLSSSEKSTLHNLDAKELYIKYFDIKWDETTRRALPVAKIQFIDAAKPAQNIIPVIYIVNQTFINIKPNGIDELAKNCLKLVESISKNNNLIYNEIQLDCDWSDASRDAYFVFLKSISQHIKNQHIKISATIRLHQVKYWQRTGIPPVDRGMLMFYNMGNIHNTNNINSIYDFNIAQRYLSTLKNYPLPLDVALPLFSWGIQRRDGHIAALLNNFYMNDFSDTSHFQRIDSLSVSVKQPFFYKGFYFKHNDTINVETITPQLALQAASQLSKYLKADDRKVVFYRLDSLILTHYETDHFKTIIDCFR